MKRLALILVCALGCDHPPPAPPDAAPTDALSPPPSDEPIIAVGWDAFRHWERWPYLRLGARAYMRSTYDRSGGNADASNFIRLQASDFNVTLDVAGSGSFEFFRANHWHGSPWNFVADGSDQIVKEQSTADPSNPISQSTWLPADVFAAPLALTWSTTQGADLSWVPIGFQDTFTIGYGRTFYGTGYYIYTLFPKGATNLSQPIASWVPSSPPDDVVALINRSGSDIAPNDASVETSTNMVTLPAAVPTAIFDQQGSAVIRALTLTVPSVSAEALGAARLRITWDDRAAPSVDAPLSLLFGTGSLFNRNQRANLVAAFPVNVRTSGSDTVFALYFPMPYFRHAQLSITAPQAMTVGVEVRRQQFTDPPNWVGYFHASYQDHGTPTPGQDLVLLDTTRIEGGGDWCGHFIGTSFIFSDRGDLGTLEGDPRFFFDDSQTPQAQGTGTEEWGGGGDYWQNGQQSTLPFAGHPVGVAGNQMPLGAEDQIESAYRFLLGDVMPFGKNARIQLEHGGSDDSTEHYQSVAYWYGLPGACLVQTDSLHVSDAVDEAQHRYLSSEASEASDAAGVDTVTSRYEWGVDQVGATEIYPATTDSGRHSSGTSELSLAIAPDNHGVLLRRKLDYSFPDQRAEVFVAADVAGASFSDAGTWYLAGSNSWISMATATETGPGTPQVMTSNRRWRDDEFVIPRQLTDGLAAIRVRLVFMPLNQPLMPGASPAPQAWSEFRYTAYSYQLPPMP